ncbi:MAG: glycerol acyltransferase, partial [Dolichospermum sp.]
MLKLQHLQKTNTGWSLDQRDPKFIESMMPILGLLYNLYFRVRTSGWENVPDEKILVVGSHNGGLASPDTSMMLYDWYRRFGVVRQRYLLMHPKVWD